jgi:hypothetical protein
MNSLVKEKMSEIKDTTIKNKHEMELVSERINFQKQSIEEHKKHNEGEIEKKRREIANSQIQITTTNRDIGLIQKHIDVLRKNS